ncbi:hypothetical protein [Acrocarpospora sp. B8E8]|uniref:hypothetical protein n=1 Tax=Acrocarpospora sp. B8E8 TaxID=3153572 RepID=UPI00325E73C3
MNDIIDRLRDATRATGGTIDSVRPLELGASRTRTWLVPVAAATAVTAAIAGGSMFVAGGGLNSAASAPVPPKFLVDARDGIVVRTVDGGVETDRYDDLGKEEWFTTVQAAQDNRLFYVASSKRMCGSNLYRLLLDENGKILEFGTVPSVPPEGNRVSGLAVSGDGTKLAYALQPCVPGQVAGLVVADTATGESRTWKSPDGFGVTDLSMSADGSHVAFRPGPPAALALAEPPVVVATPVPSANIVLPLPSGSALPLPEPAVTITLVPGEVGSTTLPAPSPLAARPTATITVIPTPNPADTIPTPNLADTIPTPNPADAMVTAIPTPNPGITVTAIPTPSAGVNQGSGSPPPSEPPTPKPITPYPTDGSVTVQSMPSGMSSCRFVTLPRTSAQWMCAEPGNIRVLDTDAPGDNLDQARTVSLPDSYEGLSGGLFGVLLSPDGSRLLGMMGFNAVEIVDGTVKRKEGISGIVAFSAEDGHAEEVLYRTTQTGFAQLLDLDGTGENLLVQQGSKIGAVTDGAYRPLTTGEADPAPQFAAELAW